MSTPVYVANFTEQRGSESSPVYVSAPSAAALQVTGGGFTVSAAMTRPANTTAYTALDVVGPAVTANLSFASIGTAGQRFYITGASLRIDVAAIPSGMTQFRLHLFNAAPTALADNAAFNLIAADRDKYLGFIVIEDPSDLGDTLWCNSRNINMQRALVGTGLFGCLQTVGAYTPTSAAVKTVKLYGAFI